MTSAAVMLPSEAPSSSPRPKPSPYASTLTTSYRSTRLWLYAEVAGYP